MFRMTALIALFLVVSPGVFAQDAEPPVSGMKIAKEIPYASVDKVHPRLLSLDVYAPPDGEKHPVVAMVHGGGWSRGDKSGPAAETKARHFVGMGYVFVSVNHRLSPKVVHPAHVQDVAKALAWVHDHIADYGGDPETIFVMGHSSGAHLTALVATDARYLEAEKKSLSIIDGVVLLDSAAYDFVRMVEEFGARRAGNLYEIAFGADREVWKDASPITHVAPGKSIPPFLIFHTGERPAGAALSGAMVEALNEAGTPAKAVHAADRDHGGMNHCIGKPGDPYTKMVMGFLAEPEKVTEDPVEEEAAPDEPSSTRPPNIVLLFADDQGWAETGAQGSTDVPTPNIDAIAAGGIRFTDGYVTAPVCSPSRAGLLTGRYQQRFGYETNPGPERSAAAAFGLPREQKTIAEHLKKLGYATGMVGKWHLGYREGCRPTERGFDEFFGFLSGANNYFAARRPERNPILRGTEVIDEPEYLTDAFGREAAAFIDRHKNEPFFLYLPFNAVHTPMEGLDKYRERFPEIEDARRLTYAAMTASMDDAVGRVIDALRRHGLEENTIVIYLSDNGGPTRMNTSKNEPLRGYKGQVYEGGIRIPFMLKWKGRLPAGAESSHPVTSLDLLPTILAAAGGQLPEDAVYDGVDLLPHLTAESPAAPHETLYWRFNAQQALRHGNLKLVRASGDADWELYDLAKNIGESRDLAAERPETVKDLAAKWEAWNAELMDPLWKRQTGGRRTGGAASGETVEQRFKRLDKNADGELTPDEVPRKRLFRRLDKNGDGVVTLEEAKAAMRSPR